MIKFREEKIEELIAQKGDFLHRTDIKALCSQLVKSLKRNVDVMAKIYNHLNTAIVTFTIAENLGSLSFVTYCAMGCEYKFCNTCSMQSNFCF